MKGGVKSAAAGAVNPRRQRSQSRSQAVVDNALIAELLCREGENAEGFRQRAFYKASRAAFLWPVEASAVVAAGAPLTTLPGIGPSLAKRLQEWIETPPVDVEVPA